MILLDGTIKTCGEAHAAKLVAEKLRLKARDEPDCNPHFILMGIEMAERLESSSKAFLTLNEIPECGAGGELIPAGMTSIPATIQTVKNPDRVSLNASLDRLDLVHQNGVLNIALDAAEAIGAKNPAEQMLAHQMAAAHRVSLDLMAEAGNTRDTIEKCRLVNTAAKLMDIYQKSLLTVNRLHTGGQQTVTVQHVQVTDGGQAVINGAVHTGGQGGKK